MQPNQNAYNVWAGQYDTNDNKTRDLEAVALRTKMNSHFFENILEIGCGTGKNSEWLVTKGKQLTAVDFSQEMLAKAKEKITAGNIRFIQADITQEWDFANGRYDLISFSLVLEHIQNLDFIFEQLAEKITDGGYVYIGELHPFKQYQGSMARFETASGVIKLECYTHNISEFLDISKKYGLKLVDLDEWFDVEGSAAVPRILSMVLQQQRIL